MEEEGGSELLQQVVDGHVKKLHKFRDTELELQNNLEELTIKLELSLSRHQSLEEHLNDLTLGTEGLLLHLHLQMN